MGAYAMIQLTKRQQDILDWIKTHVEVEGFSPTVGEIAEAFGMSANGAYCHTQAIIAKGRLTNRPGIGRTFVVPKLPNSHQVLKGSVED